MKRLFKKLILILLYYLGCFKILRFRNRNKITVLMVHGVMCKNEQSIWSPLRPQLNPSDLDRTLNILSDYYHFIDSDNCIAMLEGRLPLIKHSLLLTFDDGYKNNIDYALPICKKYGIKPLLFVATKHVNSGEPFWFDRLDYALQQHLGQEINFNYKNKIYNFDTSSRIALADSFKKFRDDSKKAYLDDIEMNKLFDSLSEKLEISSGKALKNICHNDDWSAIVSWDSLRKEVNAGFLDVGSHTIDHWRIDCLSNDEILAQLQISKASIENELSITCDYFCYPNGNYDQKSISLIKKSGYKAAFSTDVGLCKFKSDLMTLNRLNFPSNKTKAELMYLLNSK